MSNRLSKQHFWEWFKRHNKEYFQLHKKSKKEEKYWTNELMAHLRAHGRYMKFVLEHEVEGKSALLTITSRGDSRYFKKIEAFIAKAPELPGWTIQALESPVEPDFMIEKWFGHTGIDIDDFRFVKGDEKEDVFVVYHPLHTEDQYKDFKRVAKAVLYNILGERAFGLDIGYIEVDNLSYAPKDGKLLQLTELPAILENSYGSWIVNAEGKIKESEE